MTIETCKKLLEVYEKNGNTKAYENMQAHIATRGVAIAPEPVVEEPKPKKKRGKK